MYWWTSYLPSSTESLTKIEMGLWLLAGLCIIFSVLLGFAARGVNQHKTHILQNESDAKTRVIQKTAEEAKQKAIESAAKHTPRRLSDAQKQSIIQIATQYKGGKISIRAFYGDSECIVYAHDFVTVFQTAGWNVVESQKGAFPHTDPPGILVKIRDPNNPPIGAFNLTGVFVQLGIPIHAFQDSNVAPDTIEIIVGPRQ